MSKITPFLMFNDQLEAAIEFYTSTFPDSEVKNIARSGKDGPITSAEFVSNGFSLFVNCEDQVEVDEYWNKLISAGAKPMQCGWITDPFGLTWQIVPRRFMQLINDTNPAKVKAVMDAMMEMIKLEVAVLEKAYNEA